ncbi:MAG: tRNA uridine(34) 5-carboxymethylaminomethyl modification radical SAM/GNAT enzyme Elp3 [Candidatus Thermoplasmatota archaeon]|nr:tRNA uridine(34) 5-carboxymethylaminomethyl modification radical SAM/GNAT enzyme Elp3 [Candidatus Thermoplasmatota archaeon]
MKNKEIYSAIIEKILSGEFKNDKDLTKVKLWACKKYNLDKFPSNSEILSAATTEERKQILCFLRLKPIRSISGVYIITVMPKPYPCPKNEPCIYCPGGPKYGTPQSYTGNEPAGRRAKENDYDPYKQVKSRIDQLNIIGHTVDKVELIIFGGTITCYPIDYLEGFVTQCLNAISGGNAKTIEDAQSIAENSVIKTSDITIETRPDYCKGSNIDLMLKLGVTRVELGVQTINDKVYDIINRGHTIDDVTTATRMTKDSGFAVIYHMMPGLPGSTFKQDLKTFETIFEDDRFKPDAIKIYPTMIMPETKLHDMWKNGEYKQYNFDDIVKLIVEIKKLVPKWVRIQRIQRDIPLNLVVGGAKRGDLRSVVQEKLKKDGFRCNCIRCREVGHIQYKSNYETDINDIKLFIERYSASEGEEFFLSYEDFKQNTLIGLLRLRQTSEKPYRAEAKTDKSTLVRELHVFGPTVQVGKKAIENQWQHRGWGERLMYDAERISKEELDAKKLIILSGIGTKNYYKRLGYKREGPYMSKKL